MLNVVKILSCTGVVDPADHSLLALLHRFPLFALGACLAERSVQHFVSVAASSLPVCKKNEGKINHLLECAFVMPHDHGPVGRIPTNARNEQCFENQKFFLLWYLELFF